MKTLKEKSVAGRTGIETPKNETGAKSSLPENILRGKLELPENSIINVARHFHNLAKRNYSVLDGIYPLGSCTMKYNPTISEKLCSNPLFTNTHPLQNAGEVQGSLEIMHTLQNWLGEICCMDAFTLSPAAGAHGELTGLMIIKKSQGDGRCEIIVPDSSHGTNPASAAMLGFDVKQIDSNPQGLVDLKKLDDVLSEKTAGLMLTNPNTLGLFEEDILEIADRVHSAGGLLYYDGANLNAIVGKACPGEMGFDVVHVNLHKTFATPHGGGGPGSGPVGVKEKLAKYLPAPIILENNGKYSLETPSESIGRVKAFTGNFGVLLRAYCYIKMLGGTGLSKASDHAVLNARYACEKLKKSYDLPFTKPCMHEFVLSARKQKHENGVKALNIGKRMLDYGIHAPTIYFPLIVEEALMIEPTETESKESLDNFIEVMEKIAQESKNNPELVLNAPQNTPVKKLDDVKAVKEPKLK
ncbi:MAG TPA: glycine dehydrogenase subunit 2 [Candidatus Altiarchaeales archaeon]|nr:glycine dehydrogenase subunit 2 [Candidatus Altiarchaeales archaeon]